MAQLHHSKSNCKNQANKLHAHPLNPSVLIFLKKSRSSWQAENCKNLLLSTFHLESVTAAVARVGGQIAEISFQRMSAVIFESSACTPQMSNGNGGHLSQRAA